MKLLFLDSVAGVAGDMFAAAFVDAGLISERALRAVPHMLGLDGIAVRTCHKITAAIRATHLDVVVPDKGIGDQDDAHLAPASQLHDHAGVQEHAHSHGSRPKAVAHTHFHSSYGAIDKLLGTSALPDHAKEFAQRVFRLMGEAEADAHGIDLEKVHFHEVGAIDSIVDVAMAGVCIATVDPDGVVATPVKLGRGVVDITHGTHVVPPPASERLAKGFPVASIPTPITQANVELSTPTGLAILKALDPTFVAEWPAGTVIAAGSGCGTMDLGTYPNTFRIALIEALQGYSANVPSLPYQRDQVVEICCNIDDDSAEHLAWAMEHMLEMGALDVWSTPIVGKKGRAALCVSVLAESGKWTEFADWMLRNTTTFGIRYRAWDRLKLERFYEEREVNGSTVRYKIGRTSDGEVLKEKPEFEDLSRTWNGSSGQ
ncbi:MAG: LarC family nickel insertion protein [Gemmatimonadales bacterium]